MMTTAGTRKSWKVFWDLQCPYSKLNWQNIESLKERFGNDYDISIVLTSLAFHPQAFTAQCGASLVESYHGREALMKYVNACFEHQEKFMNTAIGDARKSEIDAVFVEIAKSAGVLYGELTEFVFLEKLNDWELSVKPAYTEHKIALGYGVYGTPKHVIEEKLIADTESVWGPDEWAEKLKEAT